MNEKKLDITTKIQIAKQPSEVFESIIDPAGMSNYFIESGSGKLEEGKVVTWKFPEFEDVISVRVKRIDKDKYIAYNWDMDGEELLVEITLTPAGAGQTIVTIIEKSRDNDDAGINWLKGNTEGWANFLACLKAWLEHGINLRKGAFDFMK